MRAEEWLGSMNVLSFCIRLEFNTLHAHLKHKKGRGHPLAGSSSASEGANLQSFATTVLFIVSGTFWVFFTDIYDSISRMADFTVCQGISSIIGNRYFLVRQLQL